MAWRTVRETKEEEEEAELLPRVLVSFFFFLRAVVHRGVHWINSCGIDVPC